MLGGGVGGMVGGAVGKVTGDGKKEDDEGVSIIHHNRAAYGYTIRSYPFDHPSA